ncbi:MAG: hypothetical protein WBC19_00200 [Pyrinomonadaceae bacterium]
MYILDFLYRLVAYSQKQLKKLEKRVILVVELNNLAYFENSGS